MRTGPRPRGFAPAAPSVSAHAFAGHWRDAAARRADAAVHLAGAAAALAAAPALAAAAATPEGISWPLGAYALAVAALFPASALFQHGPAAWRAVTVKIDHAAIYLKIAATCGALGAVSGAEAGMAPAGLWLLALAGAALRAAGPARMRGPSLALYLGVLLGGLATIGPALAALSPEARALALLGGALYLAGLAFHLAGRPRFHQALWHALVLAASGALCAAILTELGA